MDECSGEEEEENRKVSSKSERDGKSEKGVVAEEEGINGELRVSETCLTGQAKKVATEEACSSVVPPGQRLVRRGYK